MHLQDDSSLTSPPQRREGPSCRRNGDSRRRRVSPGFGQGRTERGVRNQHASEGGRRGAPVIVSVAIISSIRSEMSLTPLCPAAAAPRRRLPRLPRWVSSAVRVISAIVTPCRLASCRRLASRSSGSFTVVRCMYASIPCRRRRGKPLMARRITLGQEAFFTVTGAPALRTQRAGCSRPACLSSLVEGALQGADTAGGMPANVDVRASGALTSFVLRSGARADQEPGWRSPAMRALPGKHVPLSRIQRPASKDPPLGGPQCPAGMPACAPRGCSSQGVEPACLLVVARRGCWRSRCVPLWG